MLKVLMYKIDPELRAEGKSERIRTIRYPSPEDINFEEIVDTMRKNKMDTRIIFDFN